MTKKQIKRAEGELRVMLGEKTKASAVAMLWEITKRMESLAATQRAENERNK